MTRPFHNSWFQHPAIYRLKNYVNSSSLNPANKLITIISLTTFYHHLSFDHQSLDRLQTIFHPTDCGAHNWILHYARARQTTSWITPPPTPHRFSKCDILSWFHASFTSDLSFFYTCKMECVPCLLLNGFVCLRIRCLEFYCLLKRSHSAVIKGEQVS